MVDQLLPTDAFQLLPDTYATDSILKMLQLKGLGHEKSTDLTFFGACASQFSKRRPQFSKDEIVSTSIALVKMLQNHEVSLRPVGGENPVQREEVAAKVLLWELPIFLTAELSFPYNLLPHELLVSLENSLDHAVYRLVSNATAVTSNIHGDTAPLRNRLCCKPKLFVACLKHLLCIASNAQIETVLQQQNHPLRAALCEDVQQIYSLTMSCLTHNVTVHGLPDSIVESWHTLLRGRPWILVQGKLFVRPDQLCFDVDADSKSGEASLTV